MKIPHPRASAAGFLDGRIVRLMMRQTLRQIFASLGPYLLLSLGWSGAYLAVRNTLRVIAAGDAAVLGEPLSLAVIAMLIGSALFFALAAGLAIVHDRETGVLETLFYGPISHLDYLCGKCLAYMLAYALLGIVFLGGSWGMAALGGLLASPNLLGTFALSLGLAAALVSGGLLLAIAVRTGRGMTFLFIGIVLVLLALQLGSSILTVLVQSGQLTNWVFLRDILAAANAAAAWISPVAYFLRGVDALMRQDVLTAGLQFALLGLFSLAVLRAAVGLQERRGVLV